MADRILAGGSRGVELVLEPNYFPPARASQKALYDAGFPATILTTNDIGVEYKRLKGLGAKFRGEPRVWGQSRPPSLMTHVEIPSTWFSPRPSPSLQPTGNGGTLLPVGNKEKNVTMRKITK